MAPKHVIPIITHRVFLVTSLRWNSKSISSSLFLKFSKFHSKIESSAFWIIFVNKSYSVGMLRLICFMSFLSLTPQLVFCEHLPPPNHPASRTSLKFLQVPRPIYWERNSFILTCFMFYAPLGNIWICEYTTLHPLPWWRHIRRNVRGSEKNFQTWT